MLDFSLGFVLMFRCIRLHSSENVTKDAILLFCYY